MALTWDGGHVLKSQAFKKCLCSYNCIHCGLFCVPDFIFPLTGDAASTGTLCALLLMSLLLQWTFIFQQTAVFKSLIFGHYSSVTDNRVSCHHFSK